jgi:hypothetical protein
VDDDLRDVGQEAAVARVTREALAAWTAAAAITVYVALALVRLHLEPVALLTFILWLALLVVPAGLALLIASGCVQSLNTFEATLMSVLCGLIVLEFSAMLLGAAGVPGIRFAHFALGAVAWATLLARRQWPVVSGVSWRWTAAAAASVLVLHFALLPPYFSGFDADGVLHLAGIGADNFYLPFAQQIHAEGALRENPFYAGQPMLYHHYLTKFLVASYWMVTGTPVDAFQTRLIFHFILGAPLLIGLLAAVLARWAPSFGWVLVLLFIFIVPVPAYPPRGGWSGVQGMNAFWVLGVHSDLNYVLGLSVLIAVALLIDVFESQRSAHPAMGALVCLLLAAATQIKFNFAVAYAPVATALLLLIASRHGVRTLLTTAGAGVALLVVIQSAAWAICQGFTGRRADVAYGRMALETLLPALVGNADDGLAPLTAAALAVPPLLQPLTGVAAYALAYAPISVAIFLHALSMAWSRIRAIPDVFVLGTAIAAGAIALFLIDPKIVWQIAGHLHYLIPVLGLLAAARTLRVAVPRLRAVAATVVVVIAITGAWSVAAKGQRFSFWATWQVRDPALFEILRKIQRETPPDAVLLTHRLAPLADEYVAILTNRSIFASASYVYPDSHPDWPARRRIIDETSRSWPSVPRIDRTGLIGLPRGRPLLVVGAVSDAPSVPAAQCVGHYCYWTPES